MNKQILRGLILVGLFLVPFIPFLVSSALFFPFITAKAFAWRIIVEVVFAAWILLAALDSDYRPKKSVILYAVAGFLVIIGLANLFGVAPIKSFWSNFERMEGYITLLHLGMFFVVISSVFKAVDWKRWWNVSLAASFLMFLYAVLQIIGLKTINQGGVRVDGTLGNAIYLAVYMLFHIFMAMIFLWRERKNVALRWVYGLLIGAQVFVLYYTATRGAMFGLLGGALIVAVLTVMNGQNKSARRTGIALLAGLMLLVGGFVMLRNTAFVTGSPVLSRFSSLATEDIKRQGRYFVWPMALEGVKERPLLGWGQENFNYVFNEHYNPKMFALEPWFDRAHNIFLDWAVAGGLLGLMSYLALYFALLIAIWRRDQNLSHTEKSILTGLVAAYFFHNFFVFDHLISYILFFSLLAYVHGMTSGAVVWQKAVTAVQTRFFILPIMAALLVLALYFANVKPILTNIFLIKALQSLQIPGQTAAAVQYFGKAHRASRLGRPEAVEQIAANAVPLFKSDLSMEEKNAFFSFAKDAVIAQTKNLKDDARYHLMAGSFLSTVGLLDEALAYLNTARELMPGKQQTYFEIGAVYINKHEPPRALEVFGEAYRLAPDYAEAGVIYLIGAIYAGDGTIENEMIGKLTEREIVFDDRVINAYFAAGRMNRVKSLLADRIRLDPANEATYRQYLESLAN